MNGTIAYALSKQYVADTADSLGSLKGAPCTIKSITEVDGGQKVTFEWTGTSGTKQTSEMTVKNGVSVTGISDKGNGVFTLLFSDGSESDPIQTIKGEKGDKGDKLTFNDLSDEEKASLKGDVGFSPTITENADNTDKIYKLDIETVDGKFTTPNLKGADGQGGSGGTIDAPINSISVNGVNVLPDENKNVDITVPEAYDDTELIDIRVKADGTTATSAGNAVREQFNELKGDLSQLSEEKIDNPSTGSVGQILEIESVDEKGKPKTYKAVNKPIGGGEVTDEQISNAVDNYMAANPIDETDPTVPEWAKSPQKPTYTASEVGADATGTAESKVSAHNVSDIAHNDIRLLVQGLTERLNALADSDDTTLDQMSEVVAYIKSNKSLIDAITTSKINVSDIIDNLTTNVSNKPLSASQGVKLKALIDAIAVPTKLSELENDSGYAKTTDIPKTLPNPKKLTFAGAVTAVYDGSEEVTVDIPEGGGSGESGFANYAVLKNETIKTDDSGITGITYYDLDLSNYQDIVIFFDRQMNSNNTSGTTKINVKGIGYILFNNLDIGGTSDSYRSVLMRILNMGNDNVAVFSSIANNQQNNPTNLICNGIYPMNSVATDNYRNKFEISFSKTYIGTINIMIFAK